MESILIFEVLQPYLKEDIKCEKLYYLILSCSYELPCWSFPASVLANGHMVQHDYY